ncbi:acetoin utilization protein AcuC [Streptomyces purpurascens]
MPSGWTVRWRWSPRRRPGESTLRLVHREDYIEAVKAASAEPGAADQSYGLGTMDDPAFAGMHEVSSLIAGQSVGAAEAVWRGETAHAVNFAGGLHHAMPGGASGFCICNDASLAIARLLELGAERVAYIDVDVHHGDGVQAAFWDDPRVLTISLHEHPRTLFPQTGWPEETGADSAEGSAVNVALPAGTGDAGWLRAFHSRGAGADRRFPAAGAGDATRGRHAFRGSARASGPRRWTRSGRCRWPVTTWRTSTPTGGGWPWAGAATPWWTSYRCPDASGRDRGAPEVEPEAVIPEGWREDVFARTRELAPARMTDGRWPVEWTGWEAGYDPADRLDQAVLAARRAVFPLRGLLPG